MKFLKAFILVVSLALSVLPAARATVSSSTTWAQYTLSSNPQTLVVPFTFQFPADLFVLDSKTSPPTQLVLNSDYSVTGGGGNTGNVITIPGGTNGVQIGDVITVTRSVPLTQTTTFTNTGPLTAAMIGNGLDKLTMLVQQIGLVANYQGLGLQFQPDETISGVLPLSQREGCLLGFSNLGVPTFIPLASAGLGNVSGPSIAAPGHLAAFNGTTGLLIQDSGYSPSSLLAAGFSANFNILSLTGPLQYNALTYATGGNVQIRFDEGSYANIGLTTSSISLSPSGSDGMLAGRFQIITITNLSGGSATITVNSSWVAGGGVPSTLANNGSVTLFLSCSGTTEGSIAISGMGGTANTYTFIDSLSNSSGTVSLSGDSASPGNSYFYGTNGSGTKGWYAQNTIPAVLSGGTSTRLLYFTGSTTYGSNSGLTSDTSGNLSALSLTAGSGGITSASGDNLILAAASGKVLQTVTAFNHVTTGSNSLFDQWGITASHSLNVGWDGSEGLITTFGKADLIIYEASSHQFETTSSTTALLLFASGRTGLGVGSDDGSDQLHVGGQIRTDVTLSTSSASVGHSFPMNVNGTVVQVLCQ